MAPPFAFHRRRIRSAEHADRELVCPRCKGPVYRTHRRLVDRLVSLIVPVRRYRCVAVRCQWEGNIVQRRR